MARTRSTALLIVALGLCASVQLVPLLSAFVSGPHHAASPGRLVARRAEGKEGEDEGFSKFLKVEQEIELSPEEYAMALEQEVESQRKRYYIGGVVKENNLIVPWKPVDEAQLVKDARRQLKRNGIQDPNGDDDMEEDDGNLALELIGGEDTRIQFTQGEPGQKVGFIVEKKRSKDTNFREIASYENADQAFLLVAPFKGAEFEYIDEMCDPGTWNYRVLVRSRSGEIKVVDQQDLVIPEPTGLKFEYAIAALSLAIAVSFVGSYFANGEVRY
jgi:hypothetical protein